MDRLLASLCCTLATIQVMAMFSGAFQISLHTDWNRLGHYFQQEAVAIYEGKSQEEKTILVAENTKQERKKTLFVDSSAE